MSYNCELLVQHRPYGGYDVDHPQVYGHLGAPDRSAWYCHSTLQRQLASKDYDPLEWSINAATLSQFYQGKEKFR